MRRLYPAGFRFEKPRALVMRRLTILALCVLFVVASLAATFLMPALEQHALKCNGAGGTCVTCVCFFLVERLVQVVATVLIGAAVAVGCRVVAASAKKLYSVYICCSTPVLLRVRLNR